MIDIYASIADKRKEKNRKEYIFILFYFMSSLFLDKKRERERAYSGCFF